MTEDDKAGLLDLVASMAPAALSMFLYNTGHGRLVPLAPILLRELGKVTVSVLDQLTKEDLERLPELEDAFREARESLDETFQARLAELRKGGGRAS